MSIWWYVSKRYHANNDHLAKRPKQAASSAPKLLAAESVEVSFLQP